MKKCNNIDLNSIVEGRENSAAYEQALAHLETCTSCQQQLETIYEDDQCCCEVTSILKGTSAPQETDDLEDWSSDDWIYEIPNGDSPRVSADLDTLHPPIHPELLGRLGRYDVECVIGIGGMATVYKAYDTELRRVVALKVLSSHLSRFDTGRQRFAREGRAAAAILHPNVLPIYNVEANERSPYLVMQYVSGGSLQTRIEQSGPLPIEQVLRIASQTAAALAAAHQQGLVHRDVKPSNILLEEKTDRVILTDFGLARTADDAAITYTGIVAGTPRYMSPEQAAGEPIDHRSDLFSLGSVIYFMLTGQSPFRGSSVVAVLHRICKYPHEPVLNSRSDLSIQVVELVDRLLAKKPSQRFDSAAQTEEQLDRLLSLWHQGKLKSGRFGALRKSSRVKLGVISTVVLMASIASFALWSWLGGNNITLHSRNSNSEIGSINNPAHASSQGDKPQAFGDQKVSSDAEELLGSMHPSSFFNPGYFENLRRSKNMITAYESILGLYSEEQFEQSKTDRSSINKLQSDMSKWEESHPGSTDLSAIARMNSIDEQPQVTQELQRLYQEIGPQRDTKSNP